MTQPVQEPTQGRTIQGLEFRSRQLFRRPSPAGFDGAFAQVRLDFSDTNQTIAAATVTEIQWQHFTRTDADTFATGAGASSVVDSDTAGDKTLILKKVGVYIVTLFVDWIQASPDYVHEAVLTTDANPLDVHGVTITNQALATTAPDAASDYWLNDGYLFTVPSGAEPCFIRADVTNYDALLSHDIVIATMAAVYLPVTAAEDVVYG